MRFHNFQFSTMCYEFVCVPRKIIGKEAILRPGRERGKEGNKSEKKLWKRAQFYQLCYNSELQL